MSAVGRYRRHSEWHHGMSVAVLCIALAGCDSLEVMEESIEVALEHMVLQFDPERNILSGSLRIVVSNAGDQSVWWLPCRSILERLDPYGEWKPVYEPLCLGALPYMEIGPGEQDTRSPELMVRPGSNVSGPYVSGWTAPFEGWYRVRPKLSASASGETGVDSAVVSLVPFLLRPETAR